ncbi:MAG TPA: bifunctional UDP-N-acetylglucosamine diphosphorylase/glucosamine-1-phosphate N-acetyltransferase GlmU [Bryobacteraceae bacterium]|nr:bifunctional UDP-N-acetylglucosamine diphosphorylase/glucosamine-1-phosphate N-acetyltransferase GlmU [Bryobacteraceae bacterium]
MEETISIAILAAGLGTRMRSKKAKVLHQAGGRTLVEHAVDTALALAPPERVVVVVGHQAEQVQEAVARHGVRFAVQNEQKGTGHAVGCCRESLQDNGGLVIVTYGDCPLLRDETLAALVVAYHDEGAACTVITTELDEPTGYGRILRNASGDVIGIVEQKAATPEQLQVREINSGIYCFNAALLWRHLGDIKPNAASGELYLTDMVEILVGKGHRVAAFPIDDASELLGINTRLELAVADRLLRERTVREHMLAGVTIEKPETVTIDPGAVIGQDTVVEAFAQIRGKTVIGEECRIGTASILTNATIENGAVVEAFSMVADSRVGTGAKVGPFGRLRMQAHVHTKAVVGNFVELKKTELGAGSKAQHLAYLGDAVIGEDVNIGAGTITCNYDGVKKHATHIRPRSFVGSNSTLVAPVEIGEGSYIAAGSVITNSVPEDTLAVGRARQVDKQGWPSKRRSEQQS